MSHTTLALLQGTVDLLILRTKYYQLTDEGRRQLRSEVSMWKRYAQAVFKVIETA